MKPTWSALGPQQHGRPRLVARRFVGSIAWSGVLTSGKWRIFALGKRFGTSELCGLRRVCEWGLGRLTIDAMAPSGHPQRAIAETMVAKEADYVLALKGNQLKRQQAVMDFFATLLDPKQPMTDFAYRGTVDADHGRIETRQHWVSEAIAWLPAVTGKPFWPGLRSIAMVHIQRRSGAQVTTFVRYYLFSLPAAAEQLAHAVRSHWKIENQLHWSLHVSFHEDANRTRADYAPQNLAGLRHIALNLLQQERLTKASLKVKRLRAAWDNDYLLNVLSI